MADKVPCRSRNSSRWVPEPLGSFPPDAKRLFFSCTFSKRNVLLALGRMRGSSYSFLPIRRKHARFFHLLLFSLRRAELPEASLRGSFAIYGAPSGCRRSRIPPSRLRLAAPLLAFISLHADRQRDEVSRHL